MSLRPATPLTDPVWTRRAEAPGAGQAGAPRGIVRGMSHCQSSGSQRRRRAAGTVDVAPVRERGDTPLDSFAVSLKQDPVCRTQLVRSDHDEPEPSMGLADAAPADNRLLVGIPSDTCLTPVPHVAQAPELRRHQ